MTLAPGSPEWCRLVTASKVAGILGISPWESPRIVWHKMRGDLPWDEETRAMRRGNMLENAILDWWLADNPEWEDAGRQPNYNIDDWCAATPDMLVRHKDTGELMLVDAKAPKDDDHWADEPPAYYIASSLWQLAMAPQVERVCLAALFGRPCDLRSFYVTRDDDLIEGMVDSCRAFYESLSQDVPPPLSDSPAEYDAIRTVHPEIDREAEVVLPDDLADRYLLDLAHAARADATKARLLDVMGTARIARRSDGLIVARRQPSRGAVTLARVAALPDLGEPA
jgi:phage gp46-like protein